MGPALINKDDYLIMYNLGGGSRDDKLRIIDFISANLDAWVKVVGKPAAYYVVEGNDDIMEQMAKDGDAKYAERVEKVRTDYKAAYDMVGTERHTTGPSSTLTPSTTFTKARTCHDMSRL